MPARKTTRKSITTHTPKSEPLQPRRYNNIQHPSDTQLIIVIVLLVLIYPLGLIFMWAWMKHWPAWVKLLISTPLLIGLLSAFLIMLIIRSLIHNPQWQYYNQPRWNMMQRMHNPYLSPAPDNQGWTY